MPEEQQLLSDVAKFFNKWAIDQSRLSEMTESCRVCGGYTVWETGVCKGLIHKPDCLYVRLNDYLRGKVTNA